MKKFAFILSAILMVSLLYACGKKEESDISVETETDVIEAAEVRSVALCDGSITLRFSKNDNDQWVWNDDPSFPLDDATVCQIIELAETYLSGASVTSPSNLSDYGLDNESTYLTLTHTDDSVITLYFGATTESGVYMLASGEQSSVYFIGTDLLDLLSTSIYDMMILPAIPVMTPDNILDLTLTTDDVSIPLHCDDGSWIFVGSDVTESLASFTSNLETLQINRCADYAPSDGVYSVCGLLTPLGTMHVTYINTVGVESEFSLTIGSETGSYHYVTINDDPTVYYLSSEQCAPILSILQNGIN